MASYTKQMMAVAAQWLDANPDPASDLLRIPRSPPRTGPTPTDDRRLIDGYRNRLGIKAESDALIPPLLDDLKRATDELERKTDEQERVRLELTEAEDRLERLINGGLAPSSHKHRADGDMHSDLGRWLLAWARHGYNVFDLSADFVAAMLLTDARDLDLSEVKLPFLGVLMLIPDGFAKGSEGSSYTKIHLSEVSSDVLSQLEVHGDLVATIRDMPKEAARRALDKVERTIHESGGLFTPKTLLGAPASVALDGQRKPALHIYATDGIRVLDTFIERDGLTWDAFDDLPDTVTDDEDREARHAIRRVAFGALAYASAVRSASERRPTGNRRQHKDAGAQPAVWDLGRTIKLDPRLIHAARTGSREVALRIKHRHIVRGHYRQQPVGTGRQERRRIWIQPFWKGPADGAAIVHTYKIEGQPVK